MPAYRLFGRATGRPIPLGWGLVIALAIEASWEIFENTDFVINRYREATISLDYYGDSIINSVVDILAMVVGFLLAWRLPVSVTVACAIVMEIVRRLRDPRQPDPQCPHASLSN